MDSMCNEYGENEDLHKIRHKSYALFASFCNDSTAHDESQKEDSIEGVPTINEGQDFNTVVMTQAITEFHSAYTKLAKLQSKQQPNKDDDEPSFSAKLVLSQPDSEALIPATTSMEDSSVGVDREEHREDVLIDQAKHELKKDEAFLYLVQAQE